MLERLAAWFLNTYVAEYVGNVVTDQLSIGLLKGAVELEKLPLKKDALKKLNLPIDIKSGYIGKLKLQIPVRYIKSQPWVIQIDQLYVVAGPAQPAPFDAEEEERVKQSKKQAKLDSLEQQWKAEQQKSSSWWFWSPFNITFPSSVLKNLQVIINDVHIRYEDSEADPSQPFSVGVVIDNISAQSTDENWEPKFVSGGEKARKLVDLSNFSIYFDSELLGDLEGQALVNAMLLKHGAVMSQLQSMIASTMSGLQQSAEFIVKPVSGQAKLTRNCSKNPLKISDGPRFHLETQLEEIPIVLSDNQYHSLVRLSDSFQLRMKAREFSRWKPTVKVRDKPREWWMFAIDVKLREIRERNRRKSMKYTLKRAQQNVVYVMGYTQHLTQGTIPEEIQRKLKEIEHELRYEELAVLRKLAMDRVKKQRDLAEAAKRTIRAESEQGNQGFLQRWFPGWASTATTQASSAASPAGPTSSEGAGGGEAALGMSAEEDELLHELEHDYEARDNLLLRDRILLTLSFSLSGGSLQLVTTTSSQEESKSMAKFSSFLGPEPLVELCFNSLCFSADLRPRLRYASVDLSLGGLSVEDHSDGDSLFPTLVKPKSKSASEKGGRAQLFERQYTIVDPLDSGEGGASLFGFKATVEEANRQKLIQLRVHSKPLNIVYNPTTVARVKQFLTAPLTGRGRGREEMTTPHTSTGLRIRNRLGDMLQGEASKAQDYKLVSIKMDISAPHIILPEDFKDKQTSLVILDLGHVTLTNVSDWSEENAQSSSEPQLLQDIDEDEDDDELFQTPPSSPPSEEELEDMTDGGAPLSQPVPPHQLHTSLHSLASLQRRLSNDPFERYLLSLSDLQILVGKAEENWKEVTRSGQSSLHLLDRFTLSVRIQRVLEEVSGSPHPSLSLAANLPSLKFHIDEHKVHTLISCVRALRPVGREVSPANPPLLSPSMEESSMYHSAYADPGIETQSSPKHAPSSLLATSMYHSAYGTLPRREEMEGDYDYDERETIGSSPSQTSPLDHRHFVTDFKKRKRSEIDDVGMDWEQHTRRAEVKKLSAQLSINEASLTISSLGRTITEISVPGVKMEFLKRPYDSVTRLLVQDLCIVDRIQTFGPEYELVVCSSGRSLLGFSPLDASLSPSSLSAPQMEPSGFDKENQSCPNFASIKTENVTTEQSNSDSDDFDTGVEILNSNEGGEPKTVMTSFDLLGADHHPEETPPGGSLCALTYTHVSPLSPQHPAVRDHETQQEVCVERLEGEPSIHRINLQCTAIDAIANQETMVELVSFLQRSLPEELLTPPSRTTTQLTTPTSSQEREDSGLNEEHSKYQLHTEVKVQFERLGIRLLRRKSSSKKRAPSSLSTSSHHHHPSSIPRSVSKAPSSSSAAARLIAKIMLYGLSVQGTVSADVAIDGRLEGVQVTDLTPESKKYADIAHLGVGGGEGNHATKPSSVSEFDDVTRQQQQHQALSFSISRSARPLTFPVSSGAATPPSDVTLRLSVPAIHYTHSVNFVYELEMFVSDFKFYSSKLTDSMRSAAFGVAKGFVSKESHLAKGLGKLHSSFGYTSTNRTANLSLLREDSMEVEEIDGEAETTKVPDRIFVKVLVQSPVIVLPSSLDQDKCLVAHLGKIVVENEFIPEELATQQTDVTQSLNTSTTSFYLNRSSPEVERLTLTVSNISLHATQSKEGRDWLEAAQSEELSASPECCFKVLKESSISVQIDKRFSAKEDLSTTSVDGMEGDRSFTMDQGDDPSKADIVVTGRICNSLLIVLPKDVFDQIRSTLKHGIRRKPSSRQRRRTASSTARTPATSESQGQESRTSKTVHFVDSNIESSKKAPSDKTSAPVVSMPKICASFTLPRLSLELQRTIDEKSRSLVYVSLDEFSIQCHRLDPHVTSFDVALKSIVIEDLLQPKESEYRNILTSSVKPLPFISPVPTPSRSLQRLSSAPSLSTSLSRHLFPIMSTPKPQAASDSPLRSFNPSLVSSSLHKGRGGDDSSIFGSKIGNETPGRSWSTSDEAGSSQSTLKDETTTNASEVGGDLLTIKGEFVEKKCPVYASKYKSVSLRSSVDFSSVYVVINLQTWVLLFDYLGIGVPTPPPSRSSSVEPPDIIEGPLKTFEPPPSLRVDPESTLMAQSGMAFTSALENSLLQDVMDFSSLGSDDGLRRKRSSGDYLAAEEASLTSTEGSIGSDQQPPRHQEAARSSVTTSSSSSSVWGVEGKLSVEVCLNVRSLTVTFNKPEHPLARGNVSSLSAQLELNKGNVNISGSLGQASVIDLTETGAFYRERFTTTGEQALTFEVFKYGRPDPLLERPFDISGRVKMTSVRYLHTMRFLKEILAFLSHFPQLIDAFQRMKARERGNLEYFGPERKGRISLDVDIEGPVLLIPKHAFSPDLMVGDIGHVRVTNSTRYDGQEGTISHRRKAEGLDTIHSITGSTAGPVSSSSSQADRGAMATIDLSSPQRPPKLSPQSSVLSTISVSTTSLQSQIEQSSSFPSFPHGGYSSSTESIPSPSPGPPSRTHSSRRHPFDPTSEPPDNSIFGSFQNSIYSSVEEDRRRVEKQLEAFEGPCLLDCIEVNLKDVDVFSAKKIRVKGGGRQMYRIVRQPGKVLKEKGTAKLYIERNLYEDFCRNVPDLHIEGSLEAIHAMLDKPQLELIKGLIDMNLGEPIEEFEKPSTVIRDPIAQPMAADVWTGFLFRMRFMGVTLEFLQSRETDAVGSLTRSLARFDIQDSEFSFESRSNQCKTVDFTNHTVIGYDTRYEDDRDDKSSVFEEVLRPRFRPDSNNERKAIQIEIHVFLSPKEIKASILLNKLRLIGIFDLIMELKSFVFDKIPENSVEQEDDFDDIDGGPSAVAQVGGSSSTTSLHQQLASRLAKNAKPPEDPNKPPRSIQVKLSVTETDFVVVEDITSLDSSAVVLKGTVVLKFAYIPNREMNVKCSMEGLELFSCNLSNEDESALSILDPVSVSLELKPSDRRVQHSSKATLPEMVISQVFEVEIEQLSFRLSYNDIKLFLAIAQSLPNLESKEPRPDSLKKYEKEIKDSHIKKLLPLGFTKKAIRRELFLSNGDLDTAASKLLDQQQQQREEERDRGSEMEGDSLTFNEGWERMVAAESSEEMMETETEKKKSFSVGSIKVHINSLSVCLIDDCINRDVPLLDFSLSDFQAEHMLQEEKRGRAKGNFAGDYYNRNISAWEPIIEPWNVAVNWKIVKNYSTNLDSNDKPDRLSFTLSSTEQLCMNVTSSLVQILKITQESWRQDFQQKNKNGGSNVSSAATTPSTSANMLTHHRRTSSGRVVFEEPGSAFLQQHRRTPSGRVIMEESGSASLHHRQTPSGRVILEEPGSASHPAHHKRTPSGRVLLEDGTAVSEDAAASRNAAALSKMKQGLALLHSVRFVNETRQRIKFVPFLLRNSTGLPLTFATLTSAPSKVYVSASALYQKTKQGGSGMGVADELGKTSEWMRVSPGGEKPFDFNTKGKIRHRDTRSFVVHQLLVKVAGWQRIVIPISVDKIGVFFRDVRPSSDSEMDLLPELPRDRRSTRLVFAISLSDTQKVVNVRSALILHNTMELPLQVRLERLTSDLITSVDINASVGDERSSELCKSISLPSLPPRGYTAIPLHLTNWNIRVRPQDWGLQYCSKQLAWRHVVGKSPTSHSRACEAIGESGEPPFRFCVNVQRENFPADTSGHVQPAHTLTLLPPLTVSNLLPCDIQFHLLGRKMKFIKRGKEIAIYSVDSQKPIEFAVAMESFEHCHGCVVSPEKVGLPLSLIVEDSTNNRPLRLSVTTEMLGGTALKVSISCSYWLINRTGLPLVFKQEGASFEAAGQLEEHERASTTTPLLFAYSEGELVEKCSMRLGRSFKSGTGQPIWCQPFAMISDCRVRRIFVRSTDGRPDLEYQIGVDVHRGRFQYQQTRVVTLVAHYQLENRTQYKLAYLQRHQLQNQERMSLDRKIPLIMPNALMAFHWPRVDLDKLLCLRVEDIPDCQWSGGFPLDKDGAFHVHMRGNYGHSVFVRCEVALKRATYRIVLSDAANYPSPFRLENLSQISVSYCQSGAGRANISQLNPGQSIPYAWDEQTLPKKLCVNVKRSRDSQELDFETFGSRGKLYYESYFYITAADTFPPKDESSSAYHGPAVSPASSLTHLRRATNSAELVLDVPQGKAVIFRKRDPERRSQLWRMTASRRLVHIESSTAGSTNMVLDIEGGRLPSKGGLVALGLQRESSARIQSQAWRFTEDGRLLLDNTSYLCVQSKSGYEALTEGSDVVLGHVTDKPGSIPPEQKIVRLKHSPGSGVLSVAVVSDGPTRILRITDENRKYSHTSPHDDWVVGDSGQVAPSRSSDVDSCNDGSWDSDDEDTPSRELELSLILEQGVGISLINSVPEELLFASLTGIRVEFVSSVQQQRLDATVQYIQVDNKLTTSRYSVMAYPTPESSRERTTSYPVIRLLAEKVPHKSPFAIVFKTVELKLRNMTLLLEEKLLFKLLQWAGVGQAKDEAEAKEDETMSMLTYRTVASDSSTTGESKQLYFEEFQISDVELRVSMLTASQLPEDLKHIKRHLGIPLVKFESPILLDGFYQVHTLGSVGNFTSSLGKHYKKNVKSQAILILGSMDFLGNPLGLVSDVASGVSGMLALQPDVLGLVRDVTHGVSDTTSKLTGTVSHVLGKATFDSSFQEEREQIVESAQSGGGYIMAGLMGFTGGVFSGLTSMVTQPYKGAQEAGIGGFLTGIPKGVVGTVAKPLAGLFDLASGTTAAIRETTSRISRQHPPPVRHRRCCVGAGGALSPYSDTQAKGLEYLLRLNDGNTHEKLVSYEYVFESTNRREWMKVIISSQYLYFFQASPPDPTTLHSKINLDDLAEGRAALGKTSIPSVYVVLSLIDKQEHYTAPKYRCTSEQKARKIAQLINYAKNLHEEEKHVVRTLRLQQGTIW